MSSTSTRSVKAGGEEEEDERRGLGQRGLGHGGVM
jgi:hypothetical protein